MNASISKNIIIAPETDSAPLAGKVVWWDLSGSVPLHTFNEALTAAGFGEAWHAAQPRLGLRLERSLKRVAARDELVRPARAQDGMVLVGEGADADGRNSYEVGLRVWVTPLTGGEELHFSDPDHPKVEAIREAFAHYSNTLTSRDISAWLTAAVRTVRAVALRANGGYYFVPVVHLGLWERVLDVVRSCTHHEFYDLPAHTQATAIRSVLKAIEAEAEAAIAGVESKLQGGMSRRGLRGRESELETLTKKLMDYETSLGVTLGAVRERADKLKNAVAEQLLLEDD